MRVVGLIVAGAVAGPAHKWTAILQPSSDSILTGTAVVEEVNPDTLSAQIQLSGAKPGSVVSWHIHRGSCTDKGMILGAEGAYPELKAGGDGKATGGVTLAGALPPQGEYSIAVHKSSADMTVVSCGSLKAAW
jgi:Cu/Zn superoxide dismutase